MAEEGAGRRLIEHVRHRRDRHKQRSRVYRIVFGIVGFIVLLVGVILALPLVPGPGLLFVAIGLAMLALEFAWAERLLERTIERLEQAGERAARASRVEKALAGGAIVAGAAAFVAVAILWDIPGVPI